MRRALVIAAFTFFVLVSSTAQETKGKSSKKETSTPPSPEVIPANFTSAKGFVLEDATPIRLRFNRTVSSADAHVGDTVDFEVLQDLSVNGTLVIPRAVLPLEPSPKLNQREGWLEAASSRSISIT